MSHRLLFVLTHLLVFLIFCASTIFAQDSQPMPSGARLAMEKQRASIRKQIRSGGGGAHSFFTTPWMDNGQALPLVSQAAPVASGDCEPIAEESLQKMITEASQRENIDARIVRAMIRRESGGKPCAASSKGAQGLMQLMPATQIDMGVQDPFDAQSNVNAGVRYLKQMLDRYEGNLALALAAYNAGPQRVTAGGKIPEIAETQSYVATILGELNQDDSLAVK